MNKIQMAARGFALASLLLAGSTLSLRAQTRVGPAPPVSYDNKYEIFGGLTYMDFKAGEDLPTRMNLGGAEIQGTRWLNSKWGVSADYRGLAGTTQVLPIRGTFGIHRPLVYMNMGLAGVQYRAMGNQHAAIDLHGLGGIAYGVFDAGTAGAGPGDINRTASQNAAAVGLYNNHAASIIALGGSLDMNRSRNWAIRLSPDLILEHFGNEERQFFSVSGGVLYRFPPRKK